MSNMLSINEMITISSSSKVNLNNETLVLSWFMRDKVVNNLNRHKAALKYKNATNGPIRNGLFHENNQLIQLLINLPMKLKKECADNESSETARKACVTNSINDVDKNKSNKMNHQIPLSNNPLLELNYSIRDRCISLLIKNHTVVMHSEILELESNESLIEENGELIEILMDLPILYNQNGYYYPEVMNLSGMCSFKAEDELNKQLIKESEPEVCVLADELTARNMRADLDNILSNFTIELNDIKNELDQKLVKLDPLRNEAEFIFKVSRFTEIIPHLDKKCVVYSPFFLVAGLPFTLGIESKLKDKEKYLSLYLYKKNKNDSLKWICFVDLTLTLLSQQEGRSWEKSLKRIFGGSSSSTWGWGEFIEWSELMKTANEYYYDDTIKIKAVVKVDSPIAIGE